MKHRIVDLLICPACLPEENPLRLKEALLIGEEVMEGILECGRCNGAYPITDGVARLAPASRMSGNGQQGRYEEPEALASYLWSHYSDLWEDGDSLPAYSEWAKQVSPVGGLGLDMGCATGRFSFELSRKCDFVIGVDLSENFIATARKLLHQRELLFRLREEGLIGSERSFSLPESWDSGKVEFIVGDVQALPFRTGFFSCVVSLNLLDKIPQPLDHLAEANRLARKSASQLLISDPFSWSEAVSPRHAWLGGTRQGEFSGFGIDNIAGLLSGRLGLLSPPWRVAEQGMVWWKIRNHRNHFELIRSLFVKAER